MAKRINIKKKVKSEDEEFNGLRIDEDEFDELMENTKLDLAENLKPSKNKKSFKK